LLAKSLEISKTKTKSFLSRPKLYFFVLEAPRDKTLVSRTTSLDSPSRHLQVVICLTLSSVNTSSLTFYPLLFDIPCDHPQAVSHSSLFIYFIIKIVCSFSSDVLPNGQIFAC